MYLTFPTCSVKKILQNLPRYTCINFTPSIHTYIRMHVFFSILTHACTYLSILYVYTYLYVSEKGFDYVVINCGHHPASGEHYSYKKYQQSVSSFINNFNQLQLVEKSRLFWLENTAPPLREDHWVKVKKDWRTYHRLLLFHSIAMHEANRLNATMTVIPAFRLVVTIHTYARTYMLSYTYVLIHTYTPVHVGLHSPCLIKSAIVPTFQYQQSCHRSLD